MLPGAAVSFCSMMSPARLVAFTSSGLISGEDRLLRGCRGTVDAGIEGLAQIFGQFGVALAGVGAGTRGDFGGQQPCDEAILVSGPDRTIAAQERGACAFLAAKAERGVEQAIDKPFEADRDFDELRGVLLCDAIDHRAADDSFTDAARARPVVDGIVRRDSTIETAR